jgi:hypothetical protein
MKFKSNNVNETAEGIACEADLWALVEDWGVCGQCRCPLTDGELREVFSRVSPVGLPAENCEAVAAAVLEASENAWAEGRE